MDAVILWSALVVQCVLLAVTTFAIISIRRLVNSKVRSLQHGFAIIHPNGWIEMDYFHASLTETHGDTVTPDEWMRRHRPYCQLVKCQVRIVSVVVEPSR